MKWVFERTMRIKLLVIIIIQGGKDFIFPPMFKSTLNHIEASNLNSQVFFERESKGMDLGEGDLAIYPSSSEISLQIPSMSIVYLLFGSSSPKNPPGDFVSDTILVIDSLVPSYKEALQKNYVHSY